MISTEIKFIIQTLNGNTFPISISRALEVCSPTSNPYNKYGLDVLKEAISVHTGTPPIVQQLFGKRELTISDSLLPLAGQVIILIEKPSFYIDFIPTPVGSIYEFQLDANIEYLAGDGPPDKWDAVICYLSGSIILPIKVIGQHREHFKIETKELPYHLLQASNLWLPARYIITNKTPEYLWLRYDKRSMKIMEV